MHELGGLCGASDYEASEFDAKPKQLSANPAISRDRISAWRSRQSASHKLNSFAFRSARRGHLSSGGCDRVENVTRIDRSCAEPAQFDKALIFVPIDIATGIFLSALAHDAADKFQIFRLGHVPLLYSPYCPAPESDWPPWTTLIFADLRCIGSHELALNRSERPKNILAS